MGKHRMEDMDVDKVIAGINCDRGLVEGLLDLNRDEIVAVLGEIANKANIPTATFKMARTALPSFSKVKWADVASQIGLPTDPEKLNLTQHSTPRYRLPPSYQKAMFQNAWHWQDVYREVVNQTREEARLRILEPYIVPAIALYHGRIIDKPQQAMAETIFSTGGEVEHEIFMIGGVLFFIIEFKLTVPDANALAQLFLALLSAAKENMQIDFAGLRVYGLLTNVMTFDFYSYDPITKEFCFDESILVANKRPDLLADMVDVSNKIFGLILSAYKDGLRATIQKSKDRAKSNALVLTYCTAKTYRVNLQLPPVGSSSEEMRNGKSSSGLKPTGKGRNGGRNSTDVWEAALAYAHACCEKFEEPVTCVDDIEKNGNDALALLFKSIHSIPHASGFSGTDDELSTPSKLEALADRVVNRMYEASLSDSM